MIVIKKNKKESNENLLKRFKKTILKNKILNKYCGNRI